MFFGPRIFGRAGDEYKDLFIDSSRLAILANKSVLGEKSVKHDKPFFPVIIKENLYMHPDGKTFRQGIPWEYKEHNDFSKKPIKFDADHKVILEPKNIQAYAHKKGHYASTIGHTLAPFPEYMDQGYDGLRKKNFEERKRLNEELKSQDKKPFKNSYFGNGNFSTIEQAFGTDEQSKSLIDVKTTKISKN